MRLDTNLTQYDADLLQEAFTRMGVSFYELGKKAGVSDKTASKIVNTGNGHPRKVYQVAKALGLKVKPNDLGAIMKSRDPVPV